MILVTGGAGFIGSHLVERLVNEDREVVIIDDFNDYYPVAYKRENAALFADLRQVTVVEGDISQQSVVDTLFKKYPIQQVVHLAARAGVRNSLTDPLLYERVNVQGTLHILEAMRRHDVSDFFYASSSSVYGNQVKVPFSETDPVDHPISPYAATKKACELFAYTYHHVCGIRAVGFRFFTVYGERGRPDMAPALFVEAILRDRPIRKYGDGTSRRDYTYVGDIIDGIFKSLDKGLAYEVFNLGNSQTVSLNDFIATIEAITGKHARIESHPMPATDVFTTYADISKAKQLLGYSPKTSIREGLERYVAWYQQHRLG